MNFLEYVILLNDDSDEEFSESSSRLFFYTRFAAL